MKLILGEAFNKVIIFSTIKFLFSLIKKLIIALIRSLDMSMHFDNISKYIFLTTSAFIFFWIVSKLFLISNFLSIPRINKLASLIKFGQSSSVFFLRSCENLVNNKLKQVLSHQFSSGK